MFPRCVRLLVHRSDLRLDLLLFFFLASLRVGDGILVVAAVGLELALLFPGREGPVEVFGPHAGDHRGDLRRVQFVLCRQRG